MKNYKKYMGCLSLFALTLIGCEDLKFGEKFLDKPISNEQNIDSVFNKKVYAEQALAETYHSLPDYLPMQGRLGYGVLEMLTDLGDWTKKGAPKFYTGTVDGTNAYLEHLPYRLDVDNRTIGVGPIYGIRRAYIYIENVDRVTDMTADEKAIGKAEAQVIIAYHYSQMLRYYGGDAVDRPCLYGRRCDEISSHDGRRNRTENHRVAGCRRLCITLAGRCG